MSSQMKSGKSRTVGDENISSNGEESEDNQQENSELQDSNRESQTRELVTEVSDANAKSSVSDQTMDDPDSSPPGGRVHDTGSNDDPEMKSPGNKCFQTKVKKDQDCCPSGEKLPDTEAAGDPNFPSPDSKNPQNEMTKDKGCSKKECKPLDFDALKRLYYDCATDVSEESSENKSSADDDSPTSPVSGPSSEPKTISDDADVSGAATSDAMDFLLRVQRKTKKRQKATTESESESIEEIHPRNPRIFLTIRNEDSNQKDESTTTDDARVAPLEDVGLEGNQQSHSRPSSGNLTTSEELPESSNLETFDDESMSNNPENPQKPDVESMSNNSENPQKPDDSSSGHEPESSETPEDSSTDISDVEASGEDLETSGSDNLDHLGGEQSQKRKLSTIYEETEESEKCAKRLRSDEKEETTG